MEGQLKASQPKEDEGKDAGENEQAAGESEGRGSNGSVAGKEGGSKREDGKKDGGKESVWDKTWATTAGLQHVEGVSALMQGLDGPGSHPVSRWLSRCRSDWRLYVCVLALMCALEGGRVCALGMI